MFNFARSITSGWFISPNTIDVDEVFNDLKAKSAENQSVLIKKVSTYVYFYIKIQVVLFKSVNLSKNFNAEGQ